MSEEQQRIAEGDERAPVERQVFPYFGGKGRVADEVWRRFGPVQGYVEPFAGSLAMALRNPAPQALQIETLNDYNGLICNFWRSVAYRPQETASHADWPVSHLDLAARQAWLMERRDALTEGLRADPSYCDPQAAGWWVWGISQWIGSRWCAGAHMGQRPHLGDAGMGAHSMGQRPHLGDAGMGGIYDLYNALSKRLRFARLTCCDWASLRSGTGGKYKNWGVFLDPPYTAESGRDARLYSPAGEDSEHLTLGHAVAEWAREIGSEHKVALCGILGEYEMPGWEVYSWQTGGYTMGGRDRGEVIWFSPACRRNEQQSGLFG